jgi:ABC-type multidrug transport system fused ATPase/permease subunit
MKTDGEGIQNSGLDSQRGLIRQLLALLNPRERGQAALLLLVMIAQAAAELIGVASIAPFMSVVADASIIHENPTLAYLYALGSFSSDTAFLTVLGLAVIAALALTNLVSAAATWATLRFVWNTHHRMSTRLLRGYLAQPYGFFVQNNTASLNKNILGEVQTAVDRVLLPVLTGVARSILTLAVVGLLVVVDPLLALVVVVVLGGAYGIVYITVRRKQSRLGRIRVDANAERFKVAAEAFGGIKDVKVLQREADFVARFGGPAQRFSRSTASNRTIAVLPRYLLETLAFGSVLLIILYYLQAGQGVAQILPTLGLYAFAGLRLMPALQQIFGSFTEVRFNRAAIDDLAAAFERFGQDELSNKAVPLLPLEAGIHFENVHFCYPGAAKCALQNVSLTISRNQTIGLVGASGSGKTTLVDLLLGLYEPSEGRIWIDDTSLDRKIISAWRKQVGYVPQHIFLCDDSVANNIAFGVPSKEINQEQVERAARIAHLHDFIQTQSAGYKTIVGERGVRLSGGQRQRIGIARALYHDPAVLVMDEATSALDGGTENAVMEAITALAGKKTIILIAHRLSTVRNCDMIYLLEDGRIKYMGTYECLIRENQTFREFAGVDQ